VATAAISTSDSCFHDGMAPFRRPFSSTRICSAGSCSTTWLPSNGLMAPPPLPFSRWQAAQLAAYTFWPLATSSGRVQTLLGSSASAAMRLFCSSTQAVYSFCGSTFTWIGM
jgi:hypothetical protein